MVAQRAEEAVSPPAPTMVLSAAQGRFGVDHLQLVCSHAGFGCIEPRPGEDVRAIDATIAFEYGDAHVQVKCTTKTFSPKLQTIRIPIEDNWVSSWGRLHLPQLVIRADDLARTHEMRGQVGDIPLETHQGLGAHEPSRPGYVRRRRP